MVTTKEKITADFLREFGACEDGIEAFCRVFPRGAELTFEGWETARWLLPNIMVRWFLEQIGAKDDSFLTVEKCLENSYLDYRDAY